MSSVARPGVGVALVASACVVLLVACQMATSGPTTVVQGTGNVRTETRVLEPFTKIDVRRGIALRLTLGPPQRVEVTARENLVPLTTTIVRDGHLIVDATRDFACSKGITVTVTIPEITELALVGGATGRVDSVDAAVLAVRADGAAELTMTGAADWLALTSNGGCAIDLCGLRARDATVELEGGVVVRLGVSGSISGSATAGAVLTLCGSPTTVDIRTAGGSRVVRQ